MEPLKETNNVTRLPGAEDARLREPPHNFEAEQALLGAILVNNAAYQRVAEFLQARAFRRPRCTASSSIRWRKLIERGQVVSAVTLKTYVEHDEDMKAAGRRRAYLAQPGRSLGPCHQRRRFRPRGPRSLSAPSADRSRRGRWSTSAFGPTLEETALQQIEVAEKKLYDLASAGQIEGGFKPFRAALTEATVAAEAAYHRAGQLTGVATGLAQLDRLLGGLHRSDLHHPGRPSLDGQDARSPPTSPSMPPRPIARSIVERRAEGRRRRGGRLLLARNVGRAARHPHALRAGRDPVGEDPQGRADQRRLRQRARGQPRARAPQLLHRRHAGAQRSPRCAPAPAG